MAASPGSGPGPDGNRAVLSWLRRLLPGEFVSRVVEPAWEDERLGWLRCGQPPRLVQARFFLCCLWVGMPSLFWHRGRPTRATVVMAGSVAVLIAALMLLAPMLYQAYGPAG